MAQEVVSRIDERQSSYRASAPRLSPKMLTSLLVTVTFIPPLMIVMLWMILPPVKANQLKAEIGLENAPLSSFYTLPFAERQFDPDVKVVVTNLGEQPWTNINVRVNRSFNIYDHEKPVAPGERRSYLLSRFLSRDAIFDMRYNPVRDVMVYARMPDGSRATYVKILAD